MMDPYDSSGTDDDLPPSHQNRIPRGGRVAGNGRSSVGSVPYSRMYSDTGMEAQIHQLEKEAYSAVLRAFKAQADQISWDKESLITELRKELRLSNEEHREFLGRVNADDVLPRIREWRQEGGVQPGMLSNVQAVHDPLPSPTVSASRKMQKTTQSIHSQSFVAPLPPFLPQPSASSHQPSTNVKRGSVSVPPPTAKGKKYKSGPSLAPASTKPHPSSGRDPFSNRDSSGAIWNEPVEGVPLNPFIGKKVRTRWPEDNSFYEAVITDYNAATGLHVLVYDMNSAEESWEWVNLAEMSPEDIQWVDEDPGIFQHGGYGGFGPGLNKSVDRDSIPVSGRGRGIRKGQSRKDFLPSQNGIGKKAPDDIHLRHTDNLIKEVERVFGAKRPDPVEIEKAKKVLNDHEQALIDAIAKFTDLSDGDSGTQSAEVGHQFLRGQPMDRE